jgi:hypothetical protein
VADTGRTSHIMLCVGFRTLSSAELGDRQSYLSAPSTEDLKSGFLYYSDSGAQTLQRNGAAYNKCPANLVRSQETSDYSLRDTELLRHVQRCWLTGQGPVAAGLDRRHKHMHYLIVWEDLISKPGDGIAKGG